VRQRISGRRILALALSIALFAIALNLLWLATSTLRIENATGKSLEAVAFSACGRVQQVGSLAPGDSVFRLLPACGDDTLEILLDDASFCRIYVEGELYHVDAVIHSRQRVDCTYDHLFSGLFVAKLF